MFTGKPFLRILAGLLFIPLAGWAWVGLAHAQDMGARALGRGGVGRADGADVSAEAVSLAAISLAERYEMVSGAELGPDGRFLFRGVAVDSRTSAVTLGAGYRRLADNVPPTGSALPGWKPSGAELEDPTTHEGVHLGLAVPFLERRMSFAAHTRFDWRDSAQLGKDNGFNLGFSAAGRPIPTLTLAAGARNLLATDYPDTRRTADFSIRYDPGIYLGIEADVVAPLDRFTVDQFEWHAGADASMVEWLAIRSGWYADAGTHFVTGGVGLISEKASLDYGVRVRLDDPARNWHALDLRVVF